MSGVSRPHSVRVPAPRTFFKGFVLFALGACAASAQITGDIRGSVTDSSDAAVTKAKVTLTSVETGERREAVLDAAGGFAFNLLKLGNYEVKAEASGFRATSTRAEVKAGEIASVRLRLEVGQVTETVVVTDAVAQIDTENAQIQRSITGSAILEIPVNRNPNIFALVAPGVAPVSSNNPFLGSGSFNSNGGRGRGNNIMVDGITATDVSVTGTGGPLTPLIFQSLREVKIITNNFSAEYGRNSSSQALYLTKGGTNDFHGEVFEYLQNDKLNARPFFDTSGRTNVVRLNQYGFVVGGPVLIPKVVNGRNRAFFFTGWEGNKQRGQGAVRIARVPTPAQVAGITDPTARALAQQYSLPTSATGQLQTQAPARNNTWKFNARGDFLITQNDQVWFRYAEADDVTASSGLTFIGSNLPGFGATSTNRPKQMTAAYTRTLSATAVNEFRFGYGESKPAFPIDTPYALGPRINIASGEVNSFGVWEGLPQGRSQKTFQYNDNFSLVRGRHNLKMGGEYYYLEADSFFDALQRPLITFPSFADFAAGRPSTIQQRFGNSVRANRVRNFFAFFQDDWKATSNLTLNIGIRMEWAGGPTEKNKLISNLNLDNRSAFGAAGSGPFGLLETGKPSFNSNTNWGPRIGFAWTPRGSQKTVIRGGYGVAYDFVFLNPITNQRFLPPFIVTLTATGQPTFVGDNSLARFVAGTAALQGQVKATAGQFNPALQNFGAVSPAIAQNLSNTQAQQWNLGVQRETIFGLVAKASYVGTKGNFLPRTRDINLIANPVTPATSLTDEGARATQFTTAFAGLNGGPTARSNRIDPRFNTIAYVESSANSNYHAGQFELQKRMKTLLMNANYTWGKSIDDNSDVLGVLINDSATQQDPRNNRNNRSVSQFDLRSRFVLTHQWEPGWFKGSSHAAVRTLLGGWGFGGITTFRAGFPVNLGVGARRGITPITVLGGGGAVRPNINGAVNNFDPRPAGSAGAPFGRNTDAVTPLSLYAERLGLSQPLLGNIGNLGRNVLRLNGERNFDWSMYKNFNFREGTFVQFRAEFYNTFNNTSFQDIDANINSPTFGQYQTVGQNARFIQLGLRFVF
ncbi:MAG: TonB-dependent receptor [Acidobacteria bacterium]|nr:TonB-dependent receptor [Acidobacteriota bacterium]